MASTTQREVLRSRAAVGGPQHRGGRFVENIVAEDVIVTGED
jgi:hypothetical protein